MTSKQRRFERTEGYIRVLAERDAIERDNPRGDSGIIWCAERKQGSGFHVEDEDYLLEVYHEVWHDLRPRVCGGTCPYCGEDLTVEVGGNAESGPVTEAYCRNPRCPGGDPDGPDWDAIHEDSSEDGDACTFHCGADRMPEECGKRTGTYPCPAERPSDLIHDGYGLRARGGLIYFA